MNPIWIRRSFSGVSCVILIMVSQALSGAGFILMEQSISGLGVGFASGAAGMSDNSSMYFNPATLTMVKGTEITAGIHIIMPKAEFRNNGSFSTLGATQGMDATSDKTAVVPNLYVSRQITNDFSMGIAVTSPYGLATSYEEGWVGRYIALETELSTANTNVAFGYKITERLSIGGGVSLCYSDAVLSNAMNLGLTFLQEFNAGEIPVSPQTLALAQDIQANFGATKYDGHVELNGDDTGFGYNFGILYQSSESTRIGLHYRSKIKLDITGNADFTVGSLVDHYGDRFIDQAGSVSLELPDTAQISIHQYLSKDWAVMADIFHTWWSKFDELNIRFSGGLPPNVIPEKWKNVWRYSVGTTYQLGDKLQLRGGLVIDESPVPSDAYRSPRIPDEDRLWISFGLGYQLSQHFRFDLAYLHVFVDDPVFNNSTHTPGEHLKGSMDSAADVVSLGCSYSF